MLEKLGKSPAEAHAPSDCLHLRPVARDFPQADAMDLGRRTFAPYKYGRYRYTSYNYESILPEEQ